MTVADIKAGGCPFLGSLVERAAGDPGGTFDDLRRSGGDVVWNDETSTWYVLADGLVREGLKDPRLRARGVPVGVWDLPDAEREEVLPIEEFLARWLVFSDPPTQRVVRRALAPVLTRTATRDVVQQVTASAGALVQRLRLGSGDLNSDLARPLVLALTQALLGADDDEMAVVLQASDALIGYLGTEGFSVPVARVATVELERLVELVRDGLLPRGGAVPDALSPLLADGRIELVDAVAAYAQLLTGALEPLSTGLLACLVELARTGAADDGEPPAGHVSWTAFIDTVLREVAPFQFAPRTSAEELTIGGVTIPAGSRVVLNLLAANRDESPDRPDTYLSFGAGTHYCLGAGLARDFLAEILPQLTRTAVHRWVVLDEVRVRPSFGMTGYAKVPYRGLPELVGTP